MLAQSYSFTYKIPITIIRPFTVVGIYQKPHMFFPTLYRNFINNLPLKLSKGVHDYIDISDFIIAAYEIAMFEETELFNVVNVGSGKQTSNHEIVKLFEKATDYSYNIVEVEKLRFF